MVAVSDQLHCHGLHLHGLAAVAGDEHFAVATQYQRAGRNLEAILEAFRVRHLLDPLPAWPATDVLATGLYPYGVINPALALHRVKRGRPTRGRGRVLDEVGVTLSATVKAERAVAASVLAAVPEPALVHYDLQLASVQLPPELAEELLPHRRGEGDSTEAFRLTRYVAVRVAQTVQVLPDPVNLALFLQSHVAG